MAPWLVLVIVGQFLNSIASLIDKFIVTSKKVPSPIAYAFFISLLAVCSNVIYFLDFLPFSFFGIDFPSFYNIFNINLSLIIWSFVVGISFVAAIFYTYSALEKSDASDVVPVVGSVNALVTFIISYLFLDSVLTKNFLMGFLLLVSGMFIISHFRFSLVVLKYSFYSGIAFAIHFSTSKLIFNEFGFDSAFFWSRFTMGLSALALLLIPIFRRQIFVKKVKTESKRKTGFKNLIWILSNATLGGIAGILLIKAVDLGHVSIIQALGGLQFVFIALISFLVGKITPEEFGENYTLVAVIQKTVAIIFIAAGFTLLFI